MDVTNKDYLIYVKYKVIKDKKERVSDVEVKFASLRFIDTVGYNPIGKRRSLLLEFNDKFCKMVLNVVDFGIAKHYASSTKMFGYMEEMIEPDLSDNECINVYSVDVIELKENENEQHIRNNMSTLMSLFNITLLHWNINEHYIYSDDILTTNFHKDNNALYVGNNVRSSYQLYKMVDANLRKHIEKMVEELRNGEADFVSFDMVVKNKIMEDNLVRVNVIKEDKPSMYLIGILF